MIPAACKTRDPMLGDHQVLTMNSRVDSRLRWFARQHARVAAAAPAQAS
jgi:hypothetical protein